MIKYKPKFGMCLEFDFFRHEKSPTSPVTGYPEYRSSTSAHLFFRTRKIVEKMIEKSASVQCYNLRDTFHVEPGELYSSSLIYIMDPPYTPLSPKTGEKRQGPKAALNPNTVIMMLTRLSTTNLTFQTIPKLVTYL